MPTTPLFGFPYPAAVGVPPNVPYWQQQLAEAAETKIADVASRLTTWLNGDSSDGSYNVAVSSASYVLLTSQSLVVPAAAGRQIDVEWSAPMVSCPAGAGVHFQMRVGGTVLDGAGFWGGTGAIAAPARLHGTIAGDVGTTTVQVYVKKTGGGSNPTIQAIDGVTISPLKFRYRIL